MTTRSVPLTVLLNGNLRRLSSFSIVNRELLRCLRRRGFRVGGFASDDPRQRPGANPAPPDVHIANGHPWDARSAPGRLNIFALNYEYLSPDRDLRELVARLNAAFDVVIIPSAFVKPVLRAAGLRLPVEVVPWGHDPERFHPDVRPARLPPARVVFLYAGAVNPRKGVDALLAAYQAEFDAADDVLLVIKESQRHPNWRDWAAALQRRHTTAGRRHGAIDSKPAVAWIHADSASIAGFFAAADVGVFPHRGEGFGLPILECLASGRRVIVTAGSGPAAFCSARNSWSIRARRVTRAGRTELAPDPRHLRSLLRAAYRRGPATARDAAAVARSVRTLTWERTAAALATVIRRHYAPAGTPRAPRVESRGARSPAVVYAFHSRGTTSWKRVCAETERGLRQRFARCASFDRFERACIRDVDVVVGQSEHCLEVLLAARRVNPDALAMVHQECTVLGDRLAVVNRERRRCGLAPMLMSPIDLWRNRRENALANHFVVSSSVARGSFLANGFDPATVHVVPLGMHLGTLHRRGGAATTRFLFVGTDPFRKGVRVLLAAWERAALRNAELICCTDLEVTRSHLLLRYLVRNPNIILRPLLPQRALFGLYAEIDCQVLPSLEDTFAMTVGDGMGLGKPAIVSNATGIQDLIEHGVNGRIVPAGSIELLAQALRAFAADRRRLHAMGEAAYETARRYPWRRYRDRFVDLVATLARAR